MKLSQLSTEIDKLIAAHGDVPAVLWDLDSGGYFRLSAENFEAQRMADGTVRVSVGLNSFESAKEDSPETRPL